MCAGHRYSYQADENHFLPRLPKKSAQGVTGIEGGGADRHEEAFLELCVFRSGF